MTQAELLDRINSNIKANGKEAITGTELNFILVNLIGLIVDAGANWGAIGGTIEDQEDLVEYVTGVVSDYLKKDGSNADSDVTLDGYSLNAKSFHIKGTAGNGHLGMKHQSSNATAGGQETVIFAGADGEPRFKNDGNPVEQFASRSWVNNEINLATVGLLDDRGNYDASSNLFPSSGGSGTAGAILKGDLWTISVAGTLGGVSVTTGDVLRALSDSPGQTATNWVITENNLGYVPVPNTRTINGQPLSSNVQINNFYLSGQPASTNTATGGALRYIGFSDNPINTVETVRRSIMPLACTAYKFKVYINTSQPASGSTVFTIFKNGSATSIQITIPAGSGAGVYEDNVNEVSFAENDAISVQWVNNASATSCNLVSLQIATK